MGEASVELPLMGNLTTPFNEVDIVQRNPRIRHVLETYAAGKKIFPRDLLEDLDRQISEGREYVYIKDFDGIAVEYSLVIPDCVVDTCESYRIMYNSIESLTNFSPDTTPEEIYEQRPISIVYGESHQRPFCDLDQLEKTFTHYKQEFLMSDTCASIKHQFSTSPVFINKIVCFALNSPSWIDERVVARSCTQHAAVQMIAEVLKAKTAMEIKCYAQDPAYTELDRKFLKSIGITVIDDPKGFLEVDSDTLAISICPNIPVKQIIADVQWPAAMMWDTVRLGEPKKRRIWEKVGSEEDDKDYGCWISPFSTDPDSPRVKDMVQHYQSFKVDDPNDLFGNQTIYMKKE
ncbi:hypothetical protein F5884DRAFT_848760 [Xylogone sp. PMI_703]|nr:hypothetical protein F5884DRAFT_848760 [Xylogone sp. PMI_703]